MSLLFYPNGSHKLVIQTHKIIAVSTITSLLVLGSPFVALAEDVPTESEPVTASESVQTESSSESEDTESAGDQQSTTEQTSETEKSTESESKEDVSESSEQSSVEEHETEETTTLHETTTVPDDPQSDTEVDSQTESTVHNESQASNKTDETTEDSQAMTEGGESSAHAPSTPILPKTASSTDATTDKESQTSGSTDSTAGAVQEESDSATTEVPAVAGGGGSASLQTGAASAVANVVNVVNSNIFNSEGWILLMNSIFGMKGNVDLRRLDENSEISESSGTCYLLDCKEGKVDLHVENQNKATIVNDVMVRASSGDNQASGDNASIKTGDAYAAANVVNVANTNIIDSNYIVLTLNSFGDWLGDLVFPGNTMFGNGSKNIGGSFDSVSMNDADVENNTSSGADSSGNSVESDKSGNSSSIQTGNATALSNILNMSNTNMIGGQDVAIVFRIHGDWVGDVFSAPEGVSWEQTEDGLKIYGSSDMPGSSGNPSVFGDVGLKNTGTTTITNNIETFALTGNNHIQDARGARVDTGDAFAVNNIVNVANTNIFGKNWILAVINIFGNWTGNVAFGRPDLWVGGRASLPEGGAWPGYPIEFTYTVANNGDADATNVKVSDTIDDLMYFVKSDTGLFKNGKVEWVIDRLPAGTSAEVKYLAAVKDSIGAGEHELSNSATISSKETDENTVDNEEKISIQAVKEPASQMTGTRIHYTPDPILGITKTNFATSSVTASSTVDYRVVITNDGGKAYHSVLVDTIENENGEVVFEQNWDIGEILPGEEITLDYSVFFRPDTEDGAYTNYAQVRTIGRHPSLNPFYGWFADSPVASSTIHVFTPEEEEISEDVSAEEFADSTHGDVLDHETLDIVANIGGHVDTVNTTPKEDAPEESVATDTTKKEVEVFTSADRESSTASEDSFYPFVAFRNLAIMDTKDVPGLGSMPSYSMQSTTPPATYSRLAAVAASVPLERGMYWAIPILLFFAYFVHRGTQPE